MKNISSFPRILRGTMIALLFGAMQSIMLTTKAATETVDISTISSGNSGAGWSFGGTVLTVDNGADIEVIGTVSNGRYIEVAANATATITLNNVSITKTNTAALKLNGGAYLTLTLAANSVNTLDGSKNVNSAGIYTTGATLTINGTGTLKATGPTSWPGIGGNPSGTVIIESGTVEAKGGYYAAGIGGGYGYNGDGDGGNIIINGGTVTANGGESAAGIGGGRLGNGGNITINGGTVQATGGSSAAGIGGGEYFYGSGGSGGNILITGENTAVTAKGGSGAQDIGNGSGYPGSATNVFVAIPQGQLKNSSGNIGNAVAFSAGQASTGTLTATLPAPFSQTVDLLTTRLSTTGETLSVITTFTSEIVTFTLPGNIPFSITGTDLMATGGATAPVPVKAVSVGAQNGTLTAGTANSVIFTVTTAYIANGSYTPTLSGAPAGVSAQDILLFGNHGILTINTTTGTPDGIYPLTVTIDGVTSAGFDLVVAASAYNNISIASLSNGTVTANPTSATAGEAVTLTITPANNYEPDVISASKTGEPATIVALAGSGITRTFTMPDYGVTVTATFKKTANLVAVETAKGLIEGVTAYTVDQATANTSDAVKTWLAAQINALPGMSATGINVTKNMITVFGFKGATAGTAGAPAGTNGSYSFTVALSKGSVSLPTASKAGTVTATPYTPLATYAVTIAATTNGTVSASPASTAASGTVTLTITPASGYELDAISAYRTGAQATTVALAGSGNARTFTMPAYGVTVSATFKKTQAQLDKEAVNAAKAAIEGGRYQVAQGTANDAASVKAWLANTLNTLFGQAHDMQLRSATSIDGNVTITSITPATAGTASNPSGANGSFTFTVTLNRGASNATATFTSGVITAKLYTITVGTEDVPSSAKLRAVSTGGGLQVRGLVLGEMFSIYNISGQLQFSGKAAATEQLVPLRERGIYIVVSGNRSVKTIY